MYITEDKPGYFLGCETATSCKQQSEKNEPIGTEERKTTVRCIPGDTAKGMPVTAREYLEMCEPELM